MENNMAIGRRGEAIAANYYQRLGFTVLHRNFRAKGGELDLVLRRGELLLFVEVKARSKEWEPHAWLPAWARKRKRLRCAIGVYLQQHRDLAYSESRLEVVFVTHGRVTARFSRI
jgi:putative endonuclease